MSVNCYDVMNLHKSYIRNLCNKPRFKGYIFQVGSVFSFIKLFTGNQINVNSNMARSFVKLGALEAQKTAFLLCDIQETFRPHVKHFGEVVKVANKMIEAAKHFKIPVYISEQYPKGLGPTTKDINTCDAALLYEKTQFSMYTPELQDRLKKDVPGLNSIVLFGIEAHVCIEQTVIDLMKEDITVHVLADGVSSRSLMDRGLALQRIQSLGSFVTTSENVLFKLMRDKKHPAFKQISKLNKEPTVDTLGYSKL